MGTANVLHDEEIFQSTPRKLYASQGHPFQPFHYLSTMYRAWRVKLKLEVDFSWNSLSTGCEPAAAASVLDRAINFSLCRQDARHYGYLRVDNHFTELHLQKLMRLRQMV
jgi:hypothetical protein